MFFLLKLFSFLPGGNFFRTTLGKLALGAVGMAVLVVTFMIWLNHHDAEIRDAALQEFNQEQVVEFERARQEYERRIAELEEEQVIRIAELEAERARLIQEAEELINTIESQKLEGEDTPSSEVLRETMRLLQERTDDN